MRVLIIGGAGEVGRYLAKDFSQQGHEVTILDRKPKDPNINQRWAINYFQGDLTDEALVKNAVRGNEVVIHLAWSFADDPHTIFGKDIKGHIHLLDASSSAGVRSFIYTSTATVYGRAIVHPVTETHPCLIGDARKPLYALGKYTAEELCKLYQKERNLPVTIFRFWWAFGESIGGRHLRDLMKKSLKHQPLEMVQGAGGTFVTMADLSRAMTFATSNPAGSGQVYNVGSLFLTWEEIGKMMVRLTDSSSIIQLIPSDRWQGPAFLNEVWDLSSDKAERELGFKPKDSPERMRSSFMEALRTCVAQVKKEGL
jgi:nucleoside-diphosphate-sugar epimerase